MRGEDDLVRIAQRAIIRQRFFFKDIECRAGNVTAVDRFDQRRLIDDTAARHIENAGAFFHLRQLFAPNEIGRLWRQRHMNGQEISLGKDMIQIAQRNPSLGRIIGSNIGIVTNDAHPQPLRPAHHFLCHAPHTDRPQHFVAHLYADKFVALPVAGAHMGIGLGNQSRH